MTDDREELRRARTENTPGWGTCPSELVAYPGRLSQPRTTSRGDASLDSTAALPLYSRSHGELMRQRGIVIGAAGLVLWAQPAFAQLSIPCLWNPFGGCSVTFVSPDYAKRPVKPLDKDAALAEV